MESSDFEQLMSHKSHKYHDLIFPHRMMTILKRTDLEDNPHYLLKAIQGYFLLVQINPGDIIGIRVEAPEPLDSGLPSVLVYVYLKNGKLALSIIKDNVFNNKTYNLPPKLSNIDKRELENIYHFPFVNSLK